MRGLNAELERVIEDFEIGWDEGIDTLDNASMYYMTEYPEYADMFQHLVKAYNTKDINEDILEVVRGNIVQAINNIADYLYDKWKKTKEMTQKD